jgi:uncharacterized membrane protein
MSGVQLPKWLVIMLMLAFNTASGMMAMGFFAAGTKGAMGLTLFSMILGNALAAFGIPLTAPKAASAPVLQLAKKEDKKDA